jgi:hypothetical protein
MLGRGLLISAAALAFATSSTAAWASLVGDSVEVIEYYPDFGDIFGSPTAPQTVTSGGVTFADVGRSEVDVTVSGSTITLTPLESYTPNPASFNGFDIDDLTKSDITGASLAMGSGPLPTGDLSFDDHDVFANLASVPLSPYAPIVIDVQTTGGVPEPTAWAMMLIGMGALGAVLRAVQRRTKALAT